MDTSEPLLLEETAGGLAFPESPRWSERDGCWYFVEWQGDRVGSLKDGQVRTVFDTGPGSGPSGLALAPDGSFWICLYSARRLAHFDPGGRMLACWDGFQDRPFRGPNDLALDPAGRVYFTDGGDFEDDWRSGRPAGSLFLLDTTGQLEKLDDGLCFPNGVGLSVDGRHLYVCEHRKNRVLHYGLQTGSHTVLCELGGPVLLNEASAFEAGPDGMCVDPEGDLWVAHYGCGRVVVIRPDGQIRRHITVSAGRKPTNVGLHGRYEIMISEAESGSLFRVILAGRTGQRR